MVAGVDNHPFATEAFASIQMAAQIEEQVAPLFLPRLPSVAPFFGIMIGLAQAAALQRGPAEATEERTLVGIPAQASQVI